MLSPAIDSRPRPAPTARRPRRSSARTRRTHRVSSGPRRRRHIRRTGSTTTSSRGAATVDPEGFGTKAALRYRVTVAGRGKAELRLRLHRPATAPSRRATGRATRSTRWSPRARPTPTSSTRRSRRPARAEKMPILRQSCAGLVWSKQMYPYNVAAGWTATRRAAAARGAPARPQQRLAAPRLVRRARDAGPVGVPVVRRLGPRVPRDPLGAPRSGVREVPADRAAARVVPAPERRAAGVRVELRRRQPAGARDGGAPRVPHRRRHATASSSSASSRSCCSTSPGGSTARTPTATTSSAAASSGSTTSARSTARTCRTASRSSRPTARRGWRTTRSRCS